MGRSRYLCKSLVMMAVLKITELAVVGVFLSISNFVPRKSFVFSSSSFLNHNRSNFGSPARRFAQIPLHKQPFEAANRQQIETAQFKCT